MPYPPCGYTAAAATTAVQVIVGVTPQMALVKVVSDQLTELMGSKGAKDLEPGFPQVSIG